MMSWIFKLDPALIMTWGNYRSEQLTTGRGQINTVDLYHWLSLAMRGMNGVAEAASQTSFRDIRTIDD
jgi:hypothetical protein